MSGHQAGPAPGDLRDAVEIRAGYRHVCLRNAQGDSYFWGGNDSGQLGQGRKKQWCADCLPEPAVVGTSWKKAEALCAGGMNIVPDGRYRGAASHASSGQTCVVADRDAVYCWGEPDLDYLPKRVRLGH